MAQNFDRQGSYLLVPSHAPVTLPLRCFFSTSQAWWTWSGLCSSTPRGCPMARVAVDHSYIDGNNPISGHRLTFQFNTTTACPTRSTPIYPLPTNEQTHYPTQTAWGSPPPPNHSKRNKSPPSKKTSTSKSTTASPTHPLNKPCSFHNPLHTLVHISCSQEVKHMRLRIVAFVFQLPED